jgi:GWxTD domain-containing protein
MYFSNFSKVSFFKPICQKIFISLLFFLPFHIQALDFYANYASFKNTDTTSYTEYFLKIPISGLKLQKQQNGTFKASVLVNSYYLKGDSIIHGFSYYLETPPLSDTNNLAVAMLDLKRCILRQGYYRLNITVNDEFDSSNISTLSFLIDTRFPSQFMSFSDILFADTVKTSASNNKFSRNNIDILPNVVDIFSEKQPNLYFYSEFYYPGKPSGSDNIYAKYYISRDSVVLNELQKQLTLKPVPVNFVEGSLDISSLTGGEYQLIIDIFNKKNQKIASKQVSFLKLGLSSSLDKKQQFLDLFKYTKKSDLKQYLDYLTNLSDPLELEDAKPLKAGDDSTLIVEYMYKFWLKRNSEKPAKEWLGYLRKIEDANKMFSTGFQKGYLTDRGRVYVEYGPPNNVVEASDPNISYPYQIWHYYQLNNSQNNKKFVFFNRTGALDEYELIHSNAVGEMSNPNWKSIISKFNTKPNAGNNKGTFGDFLDKDFGE